MKLSNFKTEVPGISGETRIASVDVETGFLFWKKTERKMIASTGRFWFFVDSGEYTPERQAEDLERAAKAGGIVAEKRRREGGQDESH